MQFRAIACALVAALVSALVLGPAAAPVSAQPSKPTGQPAGGITIPNVTGTLTQSGQPAGTLTGGTLTISRIQQRQGQLLVDGTLTGVANNQPFTQNFRDVPLSLTDPNGGACDILMLDLGPINLDVLGLVVDLSPVELDVTAVPGPGNLLGNLLCAVAGLLDPNTGGGLDGGLQGILNDLLSIINRLLGSLT